MPRPPRQATVNQRASRARVCPEIDDLWRGALERAHGAGLPWESIGAEFRLPGRTVSKFVLDFIHTFKFTQERLDALIRIHSGLCPQYAAALKPLIETRDRLPSDEAIARAVKLHTGILK
jgi:hypothetical protein